MNFKNMTQIQITEDAILAELRPSGYCDASEAATVAKQIVKVFAGENLAAVGTKCDEQS
jgi:hypothetical protein